MEEMYFFGMVISGAGAELEQPMFFVSKKYFSSSKKDF